MNEMGYRDTASFGKRQDYSVIAELLRRGFDVYMTLVDDQGIDCVVRLDEKRYIDIQIKARSKTAKYRSYFSAMSTKPRDNYFFIFYLEKNESFWVVPSNELVSLCFSNVSGKHKGKLSFLLPKQEHGEKADRFQKYKNENGFALLKQFGLEK